MNVKRIAAVRCSDLVRHHASIRLQFFALNHPVITLRLLAKCIPSPLVRARILFNKCRILFHKSVYSFYLCRKRLLLPFYVRRARLSLLNAERELVAKHGRDWRLCVFDDQVIEFLKVSEYVHSVMRPNAPGEPLMRNPKANEMPSRQALPGHFNNEGQP